MSQFITVNLADLPPTIGPRPSKAMIESVRAHGVLVPIIVTRIDDRWCLVSGNRRVGALRANGITEYDIPAVVVDSNDAAAVTLIENELRSDNFAAQTLAVTELWASGMSKPEITTLTGMGTTTIEKHLAYANMHGSLFDAFLAGQIPATVADAIARRTPVEQDKLALIFSGKGKITEGDVKAVQQEHQAAQQEALRDAGISSLTVTERPLTFVQLRDDLHRLCDRAAAAGFTLAQIHDLAAASPAYAPQEAEAY